MPNWCTTDMVLYGETSKVERAYKEIKEVYNKPREKDGTMRSCGDWLGYLVEEILHEEVDKKGSVRCRGEYQIVLCDLPKDRTASLVMSYESAWGPCYGLMHALAAHYELDVAFRAEEPGNCVYETYDPDDFAGYNDKWVIEVDEEGPAAEDDDVDPYIVDAPHYFNNNKDLIESDLGKYCELTEDMDDEDIKRSMRDNGFYVDTFTPLTRMVFNEAAYVDRAD